jgi:alginate O-acetyltransferase complex protein AlgJ
MHDVIAVRVQAVLFVVAIFAGFAFVVMRLEGEGRETFAGMGWPQLMDGRLTKKVDDVVVAALPKSEVLDGLQAGLEYRVFNDAGPQVRPGCPGWLFLGEEVMEAKGGEENAALHFKIAEKLAARFARRHVKLVMLTVPDKARLAASELCGESVSPQSRERLARWNALVRTSGIARVDIVKGWHFKPGYWRTDTHWDDGGARFAAMRTARLVNAALGGKGTERATVVASREPQVRQGDLMHLSNLQNAPRWLQPPPDMERKTTVTWAASGDLLAAGPPPDVLLAGSSYSRNSGFADDLGLALGREVVQLSEDGSGFDGAAFDVLAKHRGTLNQAKVVVWEFPERSITQPLNDDERAFLRQGP